jgi:parvin
MHFLSKDVLLILFIKFLKTLGYHYNAPKWSVESIHSKNIVAILHLLVALVRHFRAPIRLPENVKVTVVVVKKTGSKLTAE